MFSAKEHFRQKLIQINNKISNELDFDFSAVSHYIDTYSDFENLILNPSISEKQLFYRGERINDPQRRLLPTMLRNPKNSADKADMGIVHITGEYILDYYKSLGSFVDVFSKTMGRADIDNLYEICAFAQHYYDFSPLIDFSKSIYPALSFAIKDRDIFNDDIILFVLELKNKNDYTNDIKTADKWIKELDIYAGCFDENAVKAAVRDVLSNKHSFNITEDFVWHLNRLNSTPNPKAKLIDVPTNTRMKFQQGVFLLLTDFHLFNVKYFTKSIRDDFIITKYIINKDICPQIKALLNSQTPWYSYRYLTDIEGAFKAAINNQKNADNI